MSNTNISDMIKCKLCNREFKYQSLLNKHYKRSTPCVKLDLERIIELLTHEQQLFDYQDKFIDFENEKEILINAYEELNEKEKRDIIEDIKNKHNADINRWKERLDTRDDDIMNLKDEIDKIRQKCDDYKHEIDILRIKLNRSNDTIEQTEKIIEQYEKRIDKDTNTIQQLVINNSNNIRTVSVTNNTNNTIVIKGAIPFSGSIFKNRRMELEHALGGPEGIAEYISICSIVDRESQLRCYYVTDASRANGVFLNSEGEWIKDEGGEIMKGIFINVARELKKVLYDYKCGLYDDIANEDNMPDEIVADIRRARAALIIKSRNELINPINAYVRSVMKCYRGKVSGEFKDIKHYQIEMGDPIAQIEGR